MPYKDKSIYHTNPEEALEIAQKLKSKNFPTITRVASIQSIQLIKVDNNNNITKAAEL